MAASCKQLLLVGTALGLVLAIAAFVHFEGLTWVWAKTSTPKTGQLVSASDGPSNFALLPVASDLKQPVALEFVPGAGGRAVVLEKEGRALLLDLSGVNSKTPTIVQPSGSVLTLQVRTQSEMGLLGIAFHPNYERNGRFFINYNPHDGPMRTVVAEGHLPLADLGKKEARLVRALLNVEQPYPNHNGGHLLFGPDGYLYIGMGDGGAANDPHGHGQNLGTLLGSMLRINVDGDTRPYGIPEDNPFKDQPNARPEIWAYGLRNPWRYSFDPSGRLIVGDVGQNLYEEIDVVTSGANLGWNIREASHCFRPKTDCRSSGLTEPVFEYGRDLGSSVTGGVTYTGHRLPALQGRYVFGDYLSGNLWSLKLSSDGTRAQDVQRLGSWRINPVAFARNPEGEIVIVSFVSGVLFRLDQAPR